MARQGKESQIEIAEGRALSCSSAHANVLSYVPRDWCILALHVFWYCTFKFLVLHLKVLLKLKEPPFGAEILVFITSHRKTERVKEPQSHRRNLRRATGFAPLAQRSLQSAMIIVPAATRCAHYKFQGAAPGPSLYLSPITRLPLPALPHGLLQQHC